MVNFYKILLLSSLSFSVFAFSCVLSPFASADVFESYSLLESSKMELSGDFRGGQFGSSIEYGDFNGDGLTDMFIGSPFASTSNRQWNGAMTIVFGASSDGSSRFSLYGENAGDQLGTSLAVGDFNGDGVDDIAMGAFNALVDEDRKGKVYVMYGEEPEEGGSVHTSDHFGDFALNRSDVVLEGAVVDGKFGISLLTADLNGSGFDDLIVGSSDVVYVYFGGERGIGSDPDLIIRGELPDEKFGISLAVGDFSGNGKKDLAVGAYTADVENREQVGKVYLYSDVADQANPVTSSTHYLKGYYEKSWFGFDMDSGDVTGNGVDDLLVSSFPYGGEHRNAGVYLYYGGQNFPKKTLADVIIDEPIREVLPGASVILRDFNGNGKADIVIGAPAIRRIGGSGLGKVYIIFSGDEPLRRHYRLKTRTDLNIIHGENEGDWFGYGLNGFDLNGNSINDLVVGSRHSNTLDGITRGKVFVFWGSNGPFGRIFPADGSTVVTRGELVKIVIDSFDLRLREAGFLDSCYSHKEFCLFNFIAMSSFDDIVLETEMTLYPDVPPEHPYSDYINDATVLGLVNGYLNVENSPFMPDNPVSRIQALKVILGAADLVPNKYEFELANKLGGYAELLSQFSFFADIDAKISSMWWMPRYVNFAVENGIVEDADHFFPHDEITLHELNDWIMRTLSFLIEENEEA